MGEGEEAGDEGFLEVGEGEVGGDVGNGWAECGREFEGGVGMEFASEKRGEKVGMKVYV